MPQPQRPDAAQLLNLCLETDRAKPTKFRQRSHQGHPDIMGEDPDPPVKGSGVKEFSALFNLPQMLTNLSSCPLPIRDKKQLVRKEKDTVSGKAVKYFGHYSWQTSKLNRNETTGVMRGKRKKTIRWGHSN